MAGLSGAVFRIDPSPNQQPSISTAGKKIGIALDAMSCATPMVPRSTRQRRRCHSRTSAAVWRNTTPFDVCRSVAITARASRHPSATLAAMRSKGMCSERNARSGAVSSSDLGCERRVMPPNVRSHAQRAPVVPSEVTSVR